MLKEKILQQSLAVRTPVLKQVEDIARKVRVDFDSVKPYKTDIVKWLRPIINLEGYHVYPMNGCTEGLNWWYHQEYRGVHMAPGDYQWIKPTDRCAKIVYMSIPSAINGNFAELPILDPVALDLAYVGSTKIQYVHNFGNIEYAFFSLSKAFGLRNIRTGWLFTKKPDERLEALTHSAKYFNYYAHDVAETIISNFDIDYIHNTLYNKQKDICDKLDLIPSDSVWLATTQNKEYAKFMRDGKTARISIAGVINEET